MSELKKKLKHFSSISDFESAKVSASSANTSYIKNGVTISGTPDILWDSVVFIDDIGQIWNRGRMYGSKKHLSRLSKIAKHAYGRLYDGKTIISILDKSAKGLIDNLSIFESYPGVMPSVVIAPGTIEDDAAEVMPQIVEHDIDVVLTAYENTSAYDGSKSWEENYAEIRNDITQADEWLLKYGIVTDVYKYADTSKATAEAPFISAYEEYGLVESGTGINELDADNMLVSAKSVTLASEVESILTDTNKGKLIILVVDSSMSSFRYSGILDVIYEHIDMESDKADAIYLPVSDALKAYVSAFNIGIDDSSSKFPFKVYKDGIVDANLSKKTTDLIVTKISDAIYDKVIEKLKADPSINILDFGVPSLKS